MNSDARHRRPRRLERLTSKLHRDGTHRKSFGWLKVTRVMPHFKTKNSPIYSRPFAKVSLAIMLVGVLLLTVSVESKPKPLVMEKIPAGLYFARQAALEQTTRTAEREPYPIKRYIVPPAPKPPVKKVVKRTVVKPKRVVAKPEVKKKVIVKPKVKPRVVIKPKIIRLPGIDISPCKESAGIVSGLHQNAINLYRAVCHAIPAAGPFGGYRNESGSFHQLGRAVDCMVPSHSVGEMVRDFVYRNRKALHVMEIIWEQHIWTAERASEGFRPMADRGSITANHFDHVHVSLY